MKSVTHRNNVKVVGIAGAPVIILAHGFGCDQNMWRLMLPELAQRYQIVLFDYVGSGKSLLTEYSQEKYSTLEGYAQDIRDIIEELQLTDVTIIGYSVSCTIASLAAIEIPNIITKIVMVCPSPCFSEYFTRLSGRV